MAEEKEQLRRIMRIKRSRLSKEEGKALSRLACMRLLAFPLWKEARAICLFASLPDEISTFDLLEQAWEEGKEVFLPKLGQFGKGSMDFYKCSSLSELKKGRFGLLEPDGRSERLAKADLVIAPGLAFDRSGNRLGYGGGYYDRYLSLNPQLKERCVGLGYAFQIMDFIPSNGYDVKMSFLCTEKEIIWSKA